MMMEEAVKNRELVSALADGQLRGEEFARAVEWAGHSEEGRATWHAFHLVGEVLRSGEAIASVRDANFVQRLRFGLQQEAPLLENADASELIADKSNLTPARGISRLPHVSANDTSFRWKLLAGVASLAAVSVIGWQASSVWDGQRGAVQLAQAQASKPESALQQAPIIVGGDPQVMIRDPQLDSLLAAHKQFGGTSALQMPAGFLRNATFEGAAR
jgi:sigma-E factor negative regulatory protein RseA